MKYLPVIWNAVYFYINEYFTKYQLHFNEVNFNSVAQLAAVPGVAD
jgi:hypothetical protein